MIDLGLPVPAQERRYHVPAASSSSSSDGPPEQPEEEQTTDDEIVAPADVHVPSTAASSAGLTIHKIYHAHALMTCVHACQCPFSLFRPCPSPYIGPAVAVEPATVEPLAVAGHDGRAPPAVDLGNDSQLPPLVSQST